MYTHVALAISSGICAHLLWMCDVAWTYNERSRYFRVEIFCAAWLHVTCRWTSQNDIFGWCVSHVTDIWWACYHILEDAQTHVASKLYWEAMMQTVNVNCSRGIRIAAIYSEPLSVSTLLFDKEADKDVQVCMPLSLRTAVVYIINFDIT